MLSQDGFTYDGGRSDSVSDEGQTKVETCMAWSPWLNLGTPQCLGILCFNHGCLYVLVDFVLLSYVSGTFGLEVGAYCVELEDLGAYCAVVFIFFPLSVHVSTGCSCLFLDFVVDVYLFWTGAAACHCGNNPALCSAPRWTFSRRSSSSRTTAAKWSSWRTPGVKAALWRPCAKETHEGANKQQEVKATWRRTTWIPTARSIRGTRACALAPAREEVFFCASRTASLTERRHKLGVRMGTWSFPH